eukprot:COSAG06_NODE_4496_length_4203_cov_10.653021_3_plen_50_part_00
MNNLGAVDAEVVLVRDVVSGAVKINLAQTGDITCSEQGNLSMMVWNNLV